jgi:CheY-like chemotaxis protein
MKTRDDLYSVLSLGWESSRQVWRVLQWRDDVPFDPESIGTTGRDMDQLAFDLRRLGYGKPSRLAFSAAFVLNGISTRTIQLDQDLANKTLQIVSILAEMLLELESTAQITVQEPVEIVEQLKSRWGLVQESDDQSNGNLPRPHFRHRVDDPRHPLEAALPELVSTCNEIAMVSESLLNQVLLEGTFPHTTKLSRIHHLGTRLRDRVAGLPKPSTRQASASMAAQSIEIKPSEHIRIEQAEEPEPAVEEQAHINLPLNHEPAIQAHRVDGIPRVLIIDESPFFRMLLTTAIESVGYQVESAPNIAAVRLTGDIESQDLVFLAATGLVAEDQEWLGTSLQTWNAKLVTLTSEDITAMRAIGIACHQVARTDLAGLLAFIKLQLGSVESSIRMTA